jgi:hypothetical protein
MNLIQIRADVPSLVLSPDRLSDLLPYLVERLADDPHDDAVADLLRRGFLDVVETWCETTFGGDYVLYSDLRHFGDRIQSVKDALLERHFDAFELAVREIRSLSPIWLEQDTLTPGEADAARRLLDEGDRLATARRRSPDIVALFERFGGLKRQPDCLGWGLSGNRMVVWGDGDLLPPRKLLQSLL